MASAPNHMMDAAWVPCISSLPFSIPCSTLFTLPPFSIISSSICLCLEMGGLEHSLAQLPYHCMAVSSVFPSWHWHYIHTDIILGKVPFLSLSFPFSLLYTLSFPSPAVVSTGTLFSSIPLSIPYTATAKQTPGTFLKQTASILHRSPICG